MNLVALIGNLAADPELRYTQGAGRAVCTFRLAVSRSDGESADFFTVVAWERQAEVCRDFLHKGRRVAVEGRLHHSTWEVEGEKRSRVEIVAHRVQLLGPPKLGARPAGEQRDETPAATSEPTGATFDEQPIGSTAGRELAPV